MGTEMDNSGGLLAFFRKGDVIQNALQHPELQKRAAPLVSFPTVW